MTLRLRLTPYATIQEKIFYQRKITLDMTNFMKLISKRCFSKAIQITERFHVQKLALETLQKIRIIHQWKDLWILKIN